VFQIGTFNATLNNRASLLIMNLHEASVRLPSNMLDAKLWWRWIIGYLHDITITISFLSASLKLK
jgi:hypothetical protein